MILSTHERVHCTLGGHSYAFRAPDLYDPAKARRLLTRQRVRRPVALEFQITAVAGVRALAKAVGDPEEGERQAAIIEEWFELMKDISEDDIDEPDMDLRAAQLARLEAERRARRGELHPQFLMIEANLERHWPAYADLTADRVFWDEVSRIEVVRLLLSEIDGKAVPVDGEGLLTPEAYRAIPMDHRIELATFAFGLMAPDKATEKN